MIPFIPDQGKVRLRLSRELMTFNVLNKIMSRLIQDSPCKVFFFPPYLLEVHSGNRLNWILRQRIWLGIPVEAMGNLSRKIQSVLTILPAGQITVYFISSS